MAFASWLKQAGVDSMVVAKLLGHTTSRMVELVYGHLNDATTQAAFAKLR
jgi:integrase